MWLKQLKIAVIQQDIEQIEKLLESIPVLNNTKEMEEAAYLLQDAVKRVEKLKNKTAASMQQMKKNIDFLNSATANKTAKFDITS